MSFETLGLSPALLRSLADSGYTQPTPIQLSAIPVALEGRDLLAGAQTGTGKTAGFALPVLERLFPNGTRPHGTRRIRALVLTPTRELASQVHDSFRTYGRHVGVTGGTIFGGVGMGPQIDLLRRGCDVLVATPGRLIDHMDRGGVDFSALEILVLDEADRMLDMGFLPALKKILGKLPAKRQSLLFSATFADEIKLLAKQFLRDPVEVQVTPRNTVASLVSHRVHPVDASRKRDLLQHVLAQDSRRQTLVFSRTKHGADKLVKFLDAAGFRAAAIHGNKSQNARTRALSDFKTGRIAILVATDIAARGLDIDQLPVVVNFDLPMVAEDYVHRIGRTGRAGVEGQAISLVSQDEAHLLRDIQKLLKREITMEPIAGYAPTRPLDVANAKAAPKPQQQRQPRRPARHAPAKPARGAGHHHAAGNAKPRRQSAPPRFGSR